MPKRGDLTQAVPRLEEALRLHAQFGFRQARAWIMAFLAEAHAQAGRLETALELASQSLALARGAGTLPGIGWAARALGHIAQARGALADAAEHLRDGPAYGGIVVDDEDPALEGAVCGHGVRVLPLVCGTLPLSAGPLRT